MIIFGKTLKDWKKELGVKGLYYRIKLLSLFVGLF